MRLALGRTTPRSFLVQCLFCQRLRLNLTGLNHLGEQIAQTVGCSRQDRQRWLCSKGLRWGWNEVSVDTGRQMLLYLGHRHGLGCRLADGLLQH